MGYVEGQRPHTFFAPDGTGGGSYGNQQEHLPEPFQALTEQQTSPEMIELISVLYATYTMQRQLEVASQRPQGQLHYEPPMSSTTLERYGSVLPLDPPVSERLRRASLFVEAAVHMMRGSFTAYPDDPAYLQATLNAAYAPYGFHIAEGKGEITDITNHESSRWHERIVQQLHNYAASRKAAMLPYQTLHFQIDDAYQWEPVGQWEEEPEVLLLTEHMNRIRDVHLKLFALKGDNWFRSFRTEDKATHIAGLHPYYKERYSKAGDILSNVGEGVLRDGHADDRFYWLHALAYTFNEALYDLDMHVDVDPSWTPEQTSPRLVGSSPGRITKIEEVEK